MCRAQPRSSGFAARGIQSDHSEHGGSARLVASFVPTRRQVRVVLPGLCPLNPSELAAFTASAATAGYKVYHQEPTRVQGRPTGGVATLIPKRLRHHPLRCDKGNLQLCLWKESLLSTAILLLVNFSNKRKPSLPLWNLTTWLTWVGRSPEITMICQIAACLFKFFKQPIKLSWSVLDKEHDGNKTHPVKSIFSLPTELPRAPRPFVKRRA